MQSLQYCIFWLFTEEVCQLWIWKEEKEEKGEGQEGEKRRGHSKNKLNFLGINCAEEKYSLGEKNQTESVGLFSSFMAFSLGGR